VNNTTKDRLLLDQLLGSRLRAKALAWLFMHVEERYFVRQLTALIDVDPTNLSRELARLARLELLSCWTEGRQKYYQVNRRSPVFADLHGLVLKTAGLGDALRAALKPLSRRIRAALVFGSFASGRETAESDVDLMIIGDATPAQVLKVLRPALASLGREINAVVYPTAEFRRKARDGQHFVRRVMQEEKVFLIGDDDVLSELAG
jgi:predicted nucleotidyltransferase